MGRTLMGSFRAGQSPVALFAGPMIGPLRGPPDHFNAAGDAVDAAGNVVDVDGNILGGGFNWSSLTSAVSTGADILCRVRPDLCGKSTTPARGQIPGAGYPGAAGYYPPPAGYTPPDPLPAWVLPVGIGAGVLVLGGIAFAALRSR